MKLKTVSDEDINAIKDMNERLNDIIGKSTDETKKYEGTDFVKDEIMHREN